MTTTGQRLGVFWLVAWLMISAFSCSPVADVVQANDGALAASSTAKPAAASSSSSSDQQRRTSRLQKPATQVLNTGFDEIVVESNLQVHRGASKSKSKITLPSAANSSTAASAQTGNGNKSARSLEV